MITKTDVYKSTCGDAKGWAFSVTWDNRAYPNFVSALYKTRKETREQLNRYLAGKGFDYYGSAESPLAS